MNRDMRFSQQGKGGDADGSKFMGVNTENGGASNLSGFP
ncbi:MAG: hypothetical protein AVDCRST_MAG28-2145 [uncultured Rubrobacteraceae bacterium]|uniref:Uncharacterized protein n=1 Tax=uncultured Rubrobacteraceae bacterium TaxID=349277 RepID=A0A6J4R2Y6_9ACTN|nr:MAG: hypothetical protein AVDCRST_MAG28-2145 [uncultured Rubrobacteraceae bacterium]